MYYRLYSFKLLPYKIKIALKKEDISRELNNKVLLKAKRYLNENFV